MIKISIIIPIYKVQDYIERSLNSIICQKSDDFEMECILVDRGASVTRNTGIDIAKGDFIYFVDSDDRLVNGSLKYLLDGLKAQEDSQSIDVVMGNMQLCMDGKPASEKSQIVILDNLKGDVLCKLLTRDLYHSPCNKLVWCNLLKEHNNFFEEGIIDENLLWSYFVFLQSRRVLVMPKVIYIYEDISGSVIHTTANRLTQMLRKWESESISKS